MLNQAALKRAIADFPGTVGLFLEHLSGEETLEQNVERPFPAASTIKLPMLAAVLAEPSLDLSEPIRLDEANLATGSGVLKNLTPGLTLPLRDVLTLMITISDNTATNLIIDHFGPDFFNQHFSEWALSETRLANKLSLKSGISTGWQGRNQTSPRDLAKVLKGLWRSTLLKGNARTTALSILQKQQYLGLLRKLPVDSDQIEDGEAELQIYSKSGSLRRARHDAGILSRGDQAALVVVMSESSHDLSFNPDNDGAELIGRIGLSAYQGWLE